MSNFANWQTCNQGRTVSDFEMKVYEYVAEIPAGRVATYKQVAVAIGHPNSSRAVGTALSKNPFADPNGDFYVPCHRVINSNFKIGGFLGVASAAPKALVASKATSATKSSSSLGGGELELSLKEKMLAAEGIHITNGAISSSGQYRRSITVF